MHMLVTKNMTNNTMYIVQEFHASVFNESLFNGIAFNEISFNEVVFNVPL